MVGQGMVFCAGIGYGAPFLGEDRYGVVPLDNWGYDVDTSGGGYGLDVGAAFRWTRPPGEGCCATGDTADESSFGGKCGETGGYWNLTGGECRFRLGVCFGNRDDF